MAEEKATEEKAALLLADISGYTKFIRLHRLSLLHAQAIITGLLESVIDSAKPPLQVNKLEGDCVFFYASSPEQQPEVLSECASQTLQLLSAFLTARESFKSRNLCPCDGCGKVHDLQIKFLLHWGKVAHHKVRGFDELAGEDVILIHRLLKNSVPSSQYVLMTAPFYEQSGGLPDLNPEFRQEQDEEFGKIPVAVYDLAARETEGAPARPGLLSKLFQVFRVEWESLAMIGGRKKRGGSFRNLPP